MSENEDQPHIAPLDPATNLVPVAALRRGIREMVRRRHPDIGDEGFITEDEFMSCRLEYIQHLIEDEVGEIGELEEEVVESLHKREIISTNVDEELDEEITLGQRLADRIASFGGSWTFLISFFGFFLLWMAVNIVGIMKQPFDPYPFILLNLVLSCLAAVQAPVIMMSQNRLNERDRSRAEHDYQVNLKAELEIRNLHEKMDHLLTSQWSRLVEVQKIQLELLKEIREQGKAPNP
jgi:uncharacterized membrane protein